jgi:ADP-ribosyltransferase exoenzyme
MELNEYIELHHPDALNAIRNNRFASEITELTDYEKAIIYAYSDEGYAINADLRKYRELVVPEFAIHLNAALTKLPSTKAVVHRGIWRIDSVLETYRNALKTGEVLVEYGFTSASKSRGIAEQFGEIILDILSENGKSIEKLTKFGASSFDNEKEVLFKSGSQFIVTNIKEKNTLIIINLAEI